MGTDRCAYLSKLRKVDPVPKLWFTLATLLLCVLADSVLAGLLTLAVLSALNLALGGQRPRDLARFLKVPLAFLLVGCLTIVLRPIGTAEALWAFRLLGRWRWGITAENLRALYAVDLHIVPHPRNGLPQALPLRPRGPEYREDSPHEA